jgi:hypothetical protein
MGTAYSLETGRATHNVHLPINPWPKSTIRMVQHDAEEMSFLKRQMMDRGLNLTVLQLIFIFTLAKLALAGIVLPYE